MDEGWGEPCIGSVETFEGSDVHQEAMMRRKAKDTGVDYFDLKYPHIAAKYPRK
jgi:hypothetical protein